MTVTIVVELESGFDADSLVENVLENVPGVIDCDVESEGR